MVSVNEGAMTSFNHYALGSVVSWLHQYCAGIKGVSAGSWWGWMGQCSVRDQAGSASCFGVGGGEVR